MNKSPISFYIASKEALSLGEMHEFKNTIAYENIKNLIQNLPSEDPSEIHFYKVENALIDDPWRCNNTGCIESLIWKANVMEEIKELFPKGELPDKDTPDWLIIDQLNYLKALNDSDDYEPEVITGVCQDLVHDTNYSMKVRETAAKCLYTEEMDIEAMVDILGMEPDIRTAFISENISENFPDIILELLKYDENEYIRQLAKKSLENS